MSNPSEQPANENSRNDNGRLPTTPSSPFSSSPNVKALVNTWERPASKPSDVEPPKPKHDLKEEYKDPWVRQREERQRLERVRKGDGNLRPKIKQLWQEQQLESTGQSTSSTNRRRSLVDDNASETDGISNHGGTEYASNTPKLHPLSIPPPRVSLNLPKQSSAILPSGKTAFEWAFEPFLQAHPEHRAYLVPTTPSTSHSSLPSIGSSIDSGEISVRTEDAFPPIPLENMAYYLRGKDEIATRIKILNVKQLLLRSSTLWRTAHTLENIEWMTWLAPYSYSLDTDGSEGGKMGKEWYRAYSKAGRTAETAELLARDLKIDGLQARAWYWKGRADAGRRYWDDAAVAFRQADSYDVVKAGGRAGSMEDYGGHGLTPFEKKGLAWLRIECERRNEIAQQKRLKSAWARQDLRYDDMQHGMEERAKRESSDEEEEDQPLQVGAEGMEEDYVDMAKEYPEFLDVVEKLKVRSRLRRFTPFTKEEQEYVVFGDAGRSGAGLAVNLSHDTDDD